jgi:hypothetical protein
MKTEINKNAKLQPGDVIELHFRTPGPRIIEIITSYIIEKKLRAIKEYDLIGWEFPDGWAIYTIKIKEPDDPTHYTAGTAAMIGYAIVGVIGFAAFAWTLQKVYKITESPAGGVALGLIGAVVILYLLKTLRT